jgi:LPS-assembly protein
LANQEKLNIRYADGLVFKGEDFTAYGNVDVQFGEYVMKADTVTGNRSSRQFRLDGSARFDGPTETVTGQSIDVNLRERSFAFTAGSARLAPARLAKATPGDLFFKAAEGGGDRSSIAAIDAETTTCDHERPHYLIKSRSLHVAPGRQADLRNVQITVLGRTVLHLPMVSVPLQRDARRWLPAVGQSPDEGYYVKARVTTPLPGEDFVDSRLDVMSRLGLGLGWDYSYSNEFLAGALSFYAVSGSRRSTQWTSRHEQKLFGGLLSSFASYQRLNYLTAPDSTVANIATQYSVPRTNGTTRVAFRRFSSSIPGFAAIDQSLGIFDSRRIGSIMSSLETVFQRNDSRFGSTTEAVQRIDVRHATSAAFSSLDAELLYARTIPVGAGAGNLTSNDMTPLLTLRTDAAKLAGDRFGRQWPLQMAASIGELSSLSGGSRVTRLYLTSRIGRSERREGATVFSWSSEFQQGVYSDDTAQYVLNHQANAKLGLGNTASLGVQYRQFRAFGFAPVTLDQFGQTDALAFDVTMSPATAVSLSLQSGYDFNFRRTFGSPWRSVWVRGVWDPGPRLRLDANANYETFGQKWTNLRIDFVSSRAPWELGIGLRYDFANESLAGVSARLLGARSGRTSWRMLVDYNGYTKRIDSQHLEVNYDLHCAEAVLELIDNRVGFRSGRTVGLYVRIKAFPFQSLFGQGSRGQTVGGGFGFGD